jgi:hypothetical protein
LGRSGSLGVETGYNNVTKHVERSPFNFEPYNEVAQAIFGKKDNRID